MIYLSLPLFGLILFCLSNYTCLNINTISLISKFLLNKAQQLLVVLLLYLTATNKGRKNKNYTFETHKHKFNLKI